MNAPARRWTAIEQLRLLCHPNAEQLGDADRLTRFVHAGFDAVKAFDTLLDSHAALVEALQAVVSAHDEWQEAVGLDFDDPLSDAMAQARAALAASAGRRG